MPKAKHKQLDWILITIQILVLGIGLFFHIKWLAVNYNKLQSPFIPDSVAWKILRPNIIQTGYLLLALLFSYILIVKNYSRLIIIILIIVIILLDYVLINQLGTLTSNLFFQK